jgi:hypothetical protein
MNSVQHQRRVRRVGCWNTYDLGREIGRTSLIVVVEEISVVGVCHVVVAA